ncbi:MAG: hypothetical protein KC502_23740 [Myxococcales bacterium]|nr:hypothetical protein [Myxococcales bacterium]
MNMFDSPAESGFPERGPYGDENGHEVVALVHQLDACKTGHQRNDAKVVGGDFAQRTSDFVEATSNFLGPPKPDRHALSFVADGRRFEFCPLSERIGSMKPLSP